VDQQAVLRAIDVSLAAHGAELHLVAPPDVELGGPADVRVSIVGRVDFVFVGAVPGVARSSLVRASASARLDG
jgi:hypothetical protein